MGRFSLVSGLSFAALFLSAAAAPAQAPAPSTQGRHVFLTLGTQGGPIPTATRSQPANALVRSDGHVILIDVGDGAIEQLARAGLSVANVDTVFLSHLHLDHTAGLLGLLGLRFQQRQPGIVTIYGPPGTKAFVGSLIASLQPFADGGFGIPGEVFPPASSSVKVIEMVGGSSASAGDVAVQAAQNTHYSFAPGSDQDKRFKSLSFRFDMPGRSIVYTGDTGPSTAVEELARGADLLVSEVIDIPETIALIKKMMPDQPDQQFAQMELHQKTQHLAPAEVGKIASRAGVKAVVLTHVVPGGLLPAAMAVADKEALIAGVATSFKGPITIAEDGDRF